MTYLNMNLRRIFASLFTILFLQTNAQHFEPCATDHAYRDAVSKNPELLAIESKINEQLREDVQQVVMNKRGKVLYVPVVFHIIHENGSENITQAQIMDQLRIINEDFRKKAGTNADSQDPLAADLEIEFRLAQYDPNGNKHDGINRVFSPLTNSAYNFVKGLSYWDAKKYLNIWVVKSISVPGISETVLGYAQLPFQLASSPNTDGIVIKSDQVGTIGSGSFSQAGRTLTHEIGHWLGLYHPFQGGCVGGTSSNCASQGDLVCDTPPVADASFGCNTNRNSCSNDVPDKKDMVKNYMDYSDGDCLNTFTIGQKERVTNLLYLRSQIFGTSPSFTQNISYAGINSDGTYIPVNASNYKAPLEYGFEDQNLIVNGWRINNFNNPNNGWKISDLAKLGGNYSMNMRNFNNGLAMTNGRDGFQTPEIDLSGVASPHLEFFYAYAMKNTLTNDSFTVRISNNFGMFENVIFNDAGNNLTTSGVQSGEFIPTSQNWRKLSINLNPYKSYTNARIRFEFLNRRGNNIYVDNLSITNGPTGIDDYFKHASRFNVFPNPSQTISKITFELTQASIMKIQLMDITGKIIQTIAENEFEEGKHEIDLNTSKMSKGLYFLRVNSTQGAFSHKILIN
jgi:hypothetical protein